MNNKTIQSWIVGVFILVTSSACMEHKSIDELESFLKDENFEIEAIYHGGLTGQCKVTYNFATMADSVDIFVLTYCISPRVVEQLRIARHEYEQLLNNIICLSELHQDGPATRSGCSPPWDTEYFIKRGFNVIRVFPSEIHDCSLEDILFLHKE